MDSFTGLLLLGVLILFISLTIANQGLPQACTSESKLCPDGSNVSRDALNKCEFFKCPNLELIKYCTKGINTVENKGDIFKTTTAMLGGGFTIYTPGNETLCPTSSNRSECKSYTNITWDNTLNCSTIVDNSTVFTCPQNYYEYKGYQWINCQPPINENFTIYCNSTSYKQWININCGTEVIE